MVGGCGADVDVVTVGSVPGGAVVVGAPVVVGGCVVVVDGAAVVVGDSALAFMNTTVTHNLFSFSRTAPIPTWVKSPRMFARWPDEFMNALWMELALGPRPTFSPRASQPVVTFDRFGL